MTGQFVGMALLHTWHCHAEFGLAIVTKRNHHLKHAPHTIQCTQAAI
jgi:hypothetical protein